MELFAGLLGVVLGSILAVTKDIYLDRRSKKVRASYLAIIVVGKLDRFVRSCSDVMHDEAYTDENGVLKPLVSTPDIKMEEVDVDWKSLPPDLMCELMGFPNHVFMADRAIRHVWEYGDGPPDYTDFFKERTRQYKRLGRKALQLSSRLRSDYDLPLDESFTDALASTFTTE